MNFRDLEYLIALEELKHFRKAAEKCFVSQPTLSGQIRKLEDELGIQLMERSPRKVLFTPAGLDIVAKAKTILLEVKSLKEIAKSYNEPMQGTLHIGLIPTVAPYLLPLIVAVIKANFPDLSLYLYEKQTNLLLKQLEEGELDCLILALLPGMESFTQYHLYQEPLELAITDVHPWAKQPEIELNGLRGEHVLMLEDGHCLRDQTKGFCFAAGALEDGSFQATSLETLRHMISAENGMTLLPQLAIPVNRHEGGIQYIPFKNPKPTREISLLCRKNSVRKICFEQLAKLISTTVQAKLKEYG
ncbi:transcriptional regulator, substrate-binding, LysR family protein [Psychromonas ingrahamii 37]|uniref:Transcriptional regulator, substrate-binding, LysR family protein n=1 Tax=Psychromonas ingrahamii (strain DSM 17664 / CCUG 51855 / 37) TaxID=357804 RepID=A1T0B5_PSYIN|nr:DNA-binding transcriptional regulator OxyR [Psychromonas ingrahamii]ABM05180.1 transcriptional regulator, substrate-binding, LysR family protein [Psychromonas ingrahamii 37]